MASPLEAMAKELARGFKGKLFQATLRTTVAAVSTDLDEHGDPIDVGTEDFGCEGFEDTYSAYTRATAGIPVEDVKICILAGSLNVDPARGDHVRLKKKGAWGPWHQVRQVATDPATAVWELQSFVVQNANPGN